MNVNPGFQQEETYPDIIILSLIRWDGPISSTPLALAKEFSLKSRVFYINHPQSMKDLVLGKGSVFTIFSTFMNRYVNPFDELPNLVCLSTCMTIPVNFLPPGMLYRLISSLNDRVFFQLVRRLLKEYKIKEFVFLNAFDPFYARSFPKGFPAPLKKIYYALDDISEVPYTARHGTEHEKEIAKTYDLVLTSSRRIYDYFLLLTPDTALLQNAADTTLFNQAYTGMFKKPAELNTICTQVIGYTGSLDYRTDFDLLLAIAKAHTDKTLCLVGPVFADEAVTCELFALKNVLLCGAKLLKELPAFLQYMDCMIIPFKCNKLTSSIYPLKINEYLASGKPVVSTGFSPDIREFSSVIGIADTTDSFITLINEVIRSDSPEKAAHRIKISSRNSWQKRAAEFWKILGKR